VHYEIHKLIIFVWNKDELPEEWKESIIVHIYKKGDRKDFHNCRGILHLPNMYKILTNILPLRLSPYAEENIGLDEDNIRMDLWEVGGGYGLDQAGSV
jgi:hypothetical protein